MKKYLLLTTLAGAALLANTSVAEQGGAGHYVPGQQADFATQAPSAPGWAFANIFLNYNDATASASKGLPFGRLIGLDVTANTTADVLGLSYAYPGQFLGATWSSVVYLPIMQENVKANGTIDNGGVRHAVTRQDSVSGIGDMEYSPIQAAWTNGDFHVSGMFNFWTPNAKYDQSQLANLGLGYWTFQPMLAATWLSSKIGTEVSVFTAVDFNTKNTDADYQSGDIYHLEGTVAQHLPVGRGIIGAGCTAFYLKQLTGDSGSGAKLGSFMVNSSGVGPTVSYVLPFGNGSTFLADVSWLVQTHAENTVKGDYLWIKLGLAF